MYKSKRGQLNVSIFTYIFAIIVIALVLTLGFDYISGTGQSLEEGDKLILTNSISNDVKSISKDFGSEKFVSYTIPESTELCLLDLDQRDEILKTILIEHYPLIKDSLTGNLRKNAFILDSTNFESFYVGDIEFDHYPFFKCLIPESGKIKFGLKGKGREALILAEFKSSVNIIPGKEAKLESADRMFELIIPIQNSPSPGLSQITAEVVSPKSLDISVRPAGLVSELYKFRPSGKTFSPPLELKLKYPPSINPFNLNLNLFHDSVSEPTIIEQPHKIEPENNIAIFYLSSFTTIGLTLNPQRRIKPDESTNFPGCEFPAVVGDLVGSTCGDYDPKTGDTPPYSGGSNCGATYYDIYECKDMPVPGPFPTTFDIQYAVENTANNYKCRSCNWCNEGVRCCVGPDCPEYSGHACNNNECKPMTYAWPAPECTGIAGGYGAKYGIYPKTPEGHLGQDISGWLGFDIRAISDGFVKSTSVSGTYGTHVLIEHYDGRFSLYAHLNSRNVKKDDPVKKNQIIGGMGDTGFAEGVHLHFEIWTAENSRSDPCDYYTDRCSCPDHGVECNYDERPDGCNDIHKKCDKGICTLCSEVTTRQVNCDIFQDCETNLDTSCESCGRCGRSCTNTQYCYNGNIEECPTGTANCDQIGNSCEVDITTNTNCASCNPTECRSCIDGVCEPTVTGEGVPPECSVSIEDDCGIDPKNYCNVDKCDTCLGDKRNCNGKGGCEVSLNTDSDCAFCGDKCLSTQECVNKKCVERSCSFSDCNACTSQTNCDTVNCKWNKGNPSRGIPDYCGDPPNCGSDIWCAKQDQCIPQGFTCCDRGKGWCASVNECVEKRNPPICADACRDPNVPWCPELGHCATVSECNNAQPSECSVSIEDDCGIGPKNYCNVNKCDTCVGDKRNCDGIGGCEVNLNTHSNCAYCGNNCLSTQECVNKKCEYTDCDSTTGPNCYNPENIGEGRDLYNMCGNQYYTITVPDTVEDCTISWILIPDSNTDYDLYADNYENSCEGAWTVKKETRLQGVTESVLFYNVKPGTYLAQAFRKSGTGTYTIKGDIVSCNIPTTTTTTTTIPISCNPPICGSGLTCVLSSCAGSCASGSSKCKSGTEIVCCEDQTPTPCSIANCGACKTQTKCDIVSCKWNIGNPILGTPNYCGNPPHCDPDIWCAEQDLCFPADKCCHDRKQGWCDDPAPGRCLTRDSLLCKSVCDRDGKEWCGDQCYPDGTCPSTPCYSTTNSCGTAEDLTQDGTRSNRCGIGTGTVGQYYKITVSSGQCLKWTLTDSSSVNYDLKVENRKNNGPYPCNQPGWPLSGIPYPTNPNVETKTTGPLSAGTYVAKAQHISGSGTYSIKGEIINC